MKKLLFEDLIQENQEQFVKRVCEIADELGINPDWLMLTFYIETAAAVKKKIDSKIQNSIGATGLIQFMPKTATGLGTTTAALKSMTNVQQLYWVLKYFKRYKGKIKSATDTYLAVFFPTAIGKPDDWVLQSIGLTPENIATANPGYVLPGEKRILVGTIKKKVLSNVPKGYQI